MDYGSPPQNTNSQADYKEMNERVSDLQLHQMRVAWSLVKCMSTLNI